MKERSLEATIFSPTAVLQATFTAAVTNIITANAHGLSEGDCIWVSTTTTLPAGLSASTNYYVRDVTTNTFKVSATPGGTEVDITNTGTGTHTFNLKGKCLYVGDWKHIQVHLTFSSTPTMTVKIQGSLADDAPDFNAAQSITNRWDYLEVVDLQDGAAIDGDTGIACSGTADNRIFEVNVNAMTWLTVAITSFTAGKLGVKVVCYENL